MAPIANVTHPQSQSPLMSWLGRMPALVTLLFVDQNSGRTLSVTCKYAQEFFENEQINKLLLGLHFPLFKSLKGNSLFPYSEGYARLSAAYSRVPGIVRYDTITCENATADMKLEMSPNGNRIIVSFRRATNIMRLYEIGRKDPIWEQQSHPEIIQFSPDGSFLLIANLKMISRVDLETGAITPIAECVDLIDSMQISADGKYAYLVTTGTLAHPRLRVEYLNLTTAQCEQIFERRGENLRFLSISQDGTIAILQNYDEELLFWEVQTGNILKTLKKIPAVFSIEISLDQKRAVYLDRDNCLRVLDLNTGARVCSIQLCPGESINIPGTNFHATPDMKRAVLGCFDGNFMLLDLELGKILHIFNAHEEISSCPGIIAVQMKPDGTGVSCSVLSPTNMSNACIKSFHFCALPNERIANFANAFLSNSFAMDKELFLLPSFVPKEMTAICANIDCGDPPTKELLKAIDIYNAIKVSLHPIRRLLVRAAKGRKNSELAVSLVSKAWRSVDELPPSIKAAVKRNFDQIQREKGRLTEEVLNNPQFAQRFEDGSLMEDGIEAITRTIHEYVVMAKRQGSTEGKRN